MDKALEYYQKSDEGDVVKINTDLFLAELAEKEGDYDKAYKILHQLKLLYEEHHPTPSSAVDIKLVEVCLKLGYYEQACDLCEKMKWGIHKEWAREILGKYKGATSPADNRF